MFLYLNVEGKWQWVEVSDEYGTYEGTKMNEEV